MKFSNYVVFKLMFLMIISLKLSYTIYQNVSIVSDTVEIVFILDIDESEKEESQEKDETQQFYQKKSQK